MKKIFLSVAIISIALASKAQDMTDTVKPKTIVNITASIKNQHYWRGYAVGPSPLVTGTISVTGKKSGLEIGSWNGYAFDGGFKDCDLYVQWNKKGFTLALWDIFNFSDYTVDPGMAGYGNHSSADYFDYNSKTTRHFFDLSASYDIPKTKLNLMFATIIAGRDINTKDSSQQYSSYAKASYIFKADDISITPYVSYSFAFNYKDGATGYNFYDWTSKSMGKKSGFSEIGVNFSKPIKITKSFSVVGNVGVVASPVNQTMTGLFGITLF